jgi:hypothetical protein
MSGIAPIITGPPSDVVRLPPYNIDEIIINSNKYVLVNVYYSFTKDYEIVNVV